MINNFLCLKIININIITQWSKHLKKIVILNEVISNLKYYIIVNTYIIIIYIIIYSSEIVNFLCYSFNKIQKKTTIPKYIYFSFYIL